MALIFRREKSEMFRDSSAILFLLPKQLNLVPRFLGQRFNNL